MEFLIVVKLLNIKPAIVSDIKKLGAYLKLARKRRKLSLEAVATLVGCGKSTIDNIEKGSPKVALDIVLSLLDFYGLYLPVADMALPQKDLIGNSMSDQRLIAKRSTNQIDTDF